MINLRKVKSSDLIMLFLWRNNPEIVSLSASQKKVTLEEHNQWLNASINDVNKIIYIIEKDQVALGQLRFDRVKEKSNCEVSIYLAPDFQSKGIGSIALTQGIKEIKKKWPDQLQIDAWVRSENLSSQVFFKKNGFKKDEVKEGLILFSKPFFKITHDLVDENQDFYDRRVEEYGDSYLSLNWGSKKSQELRFDVLSQISDLKMKSVLDFGCGLGHFYKWFNEKTINVNYTGIDISPRMINEAKALFPEQNFKMQNIFAVPLEEEFDYILMSGVFTYTNQNFFEQCIKSLFNKCTLGLGFNMLSKWGITSKSIEENEFFGSPEDVLKFCKTLSSKIVLKHNYHPRDFTIFIYK